MFPRNGAVVTSRSGVSLWAGRCHDHGGTGPGEHQHAGPVCVSCRSATARLVWCRVHHAEVCTGSRTPQFPLGFPEGRGSEHRHLCGAGKNRLKHTWYFVLLVHCLEKSIVRCIYKVMYEYYMHGYFKRTIWIIAVYWSVTLKSKQLFIRTLWFFRQVVCKLCRLCII